MTFHKGVLPLQMVIPNQTGGHRHDVMDRTSYHAWHSNRWCVYFRRYRWREFEWGMQAMSAYTQSLKRVADTLPEIEKSEELKEHTQAKTEILRAYIHLIKALSYLDEADM